MTTAHTPTPWEFRGEKRLVQKIGNEQGNYILFHDAVWKIKPEDAAFIVRACNSHYGAFEFLSDLEMECQSYLASTHPELRSRLSTILAKMYGG